MYDATMEATEPVDEDYDDRYVETDAERVYRERIAAGWFCPPRPPLRAHYRCEASGCLNEANRRGLGGWYLCVAHTIKDVDWRM